MSGKKSIRLLLQLVIVGLVTWGVYRALQKSSDQLQSRREELGRQAAQLEEQARDATPEQRQSMQKQAAELRHQVQHFWQADWKYLALSGLVYAVSMLPAAAYWNRCLRAMGQEASAGYVRWAYFYGNLGKYVPGKAMVIIMRIACLSQFNVRKVATTITIFLETLTLMAVGGTVGAVCVLLLNIDYRISLLAIGFLLCTAVPTAPGLLRWILRRLQSGVDAAILDQWTARLNWSLIGTGWIYLSITWIGFGLSLGIVLLGLPSLQWLATSTLHFWLGVYAACSLSVVIGFVSMVPSGAGVREIVLATILTPIVGPTAALCSAIWLRLTWLVAELLMAALFYLLIWRDK